MMHGPCGKLNPTNSCMKKKGYCKNKYPKDTDNISKIASNPMIRKTMLIEFFLMNKSNKEAMDLNLLYREFPEHFVVNSR
ncbi:hypothetical protein H5410_006015 [Solanum commersonii]|uniref:Uncharacterized protein n=1 Tax=Solanum commersonii TaxID=4109 RepID=A0A9J6A867_SOLCO|nr:hypothetical protein H5410_006015 [Solanum commersonii]